MANKLGPPNSSILSSLLFLTLIIRTSLAARNLNDNVLEWVKKDHHRFLRAVIYVSNLDRSVRFYTQSFGMKLLKRRNFPDRQYKDALIGFGPQNTHFLLELRHRHDSNDVFIGTEFGHFGIATQDVYKSVEKARANGALVIHKPQKVNQTIVAFVQDRDGYKFKLIQRTSLTDPLVQIMLHVQDLNPSLNFYTKALGMKLFERQNNSTGQECIQNSQDALRKIILRCPRRISRCMGILHYRKTNTIVSGTLGYGINQSKTTVLQLEKRKNIPRDDGRDGYSMVYIGTDNVNKSAEAAKLVMKELGGNIVIEPVLLSNINVKLTGFSDPDNWITIMVDNKDYQRGTL